jgi:hypothetical protein
MIDEEINLNHWWIDNDRWENRSTRDEILVAVPIYPRHKFHMDWRGLNSGLRGDGQTIASKPTRRCACIWVFRVL